jgi:hypothetical protein
LPGYETIRQAKTQNYDPDKAAFSVEEDRMYAQVHNVDDHDHEDISYSSRYGAQNSAYGSGSVAPENPFDDTIATAYDPQAPTTRIYAPPVSHDAYDDSRPAQFPAANYDRGV